MKTAIALKGKGDFHTTEYPFRAQQQQVLGYGLKLSSPTSPPPACHANPQTAAQAQPNIMASRRIFDPIVLLRITPLLTTTALTTYTLALFIQNPPPFAHDTRPYYVTPRERVVPISVKLTSALTAITAVSSIANLLVRRNALIAAHQAGWWYVASGALALARLGALGAIVALVERGASEGRNRGVLDRLERGRVGWLWVVDVAGWSALLAGVLGSLRA